jgi:hypothetical protein
MRFVFDVLDHQTTSDYEIVPFTEIIGISEKLESVTLIQTYKTYSYNNPLHG